MTIDKQRWLQVETLYHAALEREPLARADFLEEACAGDEELRREVEELLRYDGAAESFIQGNALAFEARRLKPEELSQTAPQLLPGQSVGAYKITALLGRGGMGVVYRARDERLRRDVAIKVLPATFANDADRLRRFEQEAHATSALNHPNILTVHDLGTTRTSLTLGWNGSRARDARARSVMDAGATVAVRRIHGRRRGIACLGGFQRR
jgi:eukaryotic-like serine/threonine-protein kinase